MKKLLTSLIEFYQTFLSFDKGLLSVFAVGGACRSEISCSEFTKQSINEFGVVKGIGLGIKRIWSCK